MFAHRCHCETRPITAGAWAMGRATSIRTTIRPDSRSTSCRTSSEDAGTTNRAKAARKAHASPADTSKPRLVGATADAVRGHRREPAPERLVCRSGALDVVLDAAELELAGAAPHRVRRS